MVRRRLTAPVRRKLGITPQRAQRAREDQSSLLERAVGETGFAVVVEEAGEGELGEGEGAAGVVF